MTTTRRDPLSDLALIGTVLLCAFSARASLVEQCGAASAPSGPATYEFCITSLQVVPGAATADTAGLAGIAVNLTSANTTATFDKISDLYNSRNGSLPLQTLNDCLLAYDDLSDDLADAIEAIRSSSFGDAVPSLGDALTQVASCDKALALADWPDLLRKEDDDATGLLTITLNLAKQLSK